MIGVLITFNLSQILSIFLHYVPKVVKTDSIWPSMGQSLKPYSRWPRVGGFSATAVGKSESAVVRASTCHGLPTVVRYRFVHRRPPHTVVWHGIVHHRTVCVVWHGMVWPLAAMGATTTVPSIPLAYRQLG